MQHHSISAGSGPGSGTQGWQCLIDRWKRPSLPCVARAAVHIHPPLAMWIGLLSAKLDWWAAGPQASSRPRLLVGAALVNCCSLLQTALSALYHSGRRCSNCGTTCPERTASGLSSCTLFAFRVTGYSVQQQRTTAAARDSSKAQSNTSPPPPKPDPDLRLPPASAPPPCLFSKPYCDLTYLALRCSLLPHW